MARRPFYSSHLRLSAPSADHSYSFSFESADDTDFVRHASNSSVVRRSFSASGTFEASGVSGGGGVAGALYGHCPQLGSSSRIGVGLVLHNGTLWAVAQGGE